MSKINKTTRPIQRLRKYFLKSFPKELRMNAYITIRRIYFIDHIKVMRHFVLLSIKPIH